MSIVAYVLSAHVLTCKLPCRPTHCPNNYLTLSLHIMLAPAKALREEVLVIVASAARHMIQLLFVVDKSQPSATKLVSSCGVRCRLLEV